ncbi:hypothetical protein JKP88DRAFT_153157, partial [Tribonema minus]
VWITQYVDYCSKYGVGFLLNTGSAGVYFNDATKMVLDPAGHRFEYWERSAAPPASSALLSASTHTLSNYPSALQKKVTLLTHFRSFLFTQERRAGRTATAAPAPSSEPLVHVKKYVATRYAWLFRLSNGTLQVIFTDGSEVLIGRGAHAVTYVARDG